ncbi:hypothetical protein QJS10_CPA06g01698 [Acorus calamus]|uniref:Uncharacterized protein n=1 Tax=Acorus calamus TaxID=4465 RepID=A0AAV9EKL1_ACOCL|nr:hypothetical protein QJS10_CPA06g01698 [Acorus calamus]
MTRKPQGAAPMVKVGGIGGSVSKPSKERCCGKKRNGKGVCSDYHASRKRIYPRENLGGIQAGDGDGGPIENRVEDPYIVSVSSVPPSASKEGCCEVVDTKYDLVTQSLSRPAEECICTLNTEDPEIPCNDDAYSPIQIFLPVPYCEELNVTIETQDAPAEPHCPSKKIGSPPEAPSVVDDGNMMEELAKSCSGQNGSLESTTTLSISDQEKQLSASVDEVLCYPDIDALILSMDLGIDDREPCPFKEVSRYHNSDTNGRLEQSARVYVRRAIASHGALAVFYSCHLKYYIKKPEAIIKMDEDGSFSIKNTGKYSIFVNRKGTKEAELLLFHESHIELVRGMTFVFEVNQNSMNHYIADVMEGNSQDMKAKFEWSPANN